MVVNTKQRFLAPDGSDLPNLMVSEDQVKRCPAQSKPDSQKHTSSDAENCELIARNPTGLSVNTSKPDLKKLTGKRKAERAKRATAKKRKHKQLKRAAKRDPGDSLTFAPGDDERKRMVKVLSFKTTNRDRVKLEKSLTREFLRIYKRRRRELQPDYIMVDKEGKHATEAARLCIIKCVTPTQLLDYWVENVGNFTGMRFPPLSFLAVAGNVDRVSVEVAIEPGKSRKQPRRRKDTHEVHAYSGELDRRLRRGLMEAGIIESTEISDRFLMTVQTTARSIANGHDLFVSSKLRPMVDWALEHLYADRS